MIRRTPILVSALLISLVVYFVLFAYLCQRTISCRLIASAPTAARRAPQGYVDVLGFPVAISVLVTLALTIPALLAANQFAVWHRRRTRDRLGQCLDCGYPLRTWRGRCPSCGVRIGPG